MRYVRESTCIYMYQSTCIRILNYLTCVRERRVFYLLKDIRHLCFWFSRNAFAVGEGGDVQMNDSGIDNDAAVGWLSSVNGMQHARRVSQRHEEPPTGSTSARCDAGKSKTAMCPATKYVPADTFDVVTHREQPRNDEIVKSKVAERRRAIPAFMWKERTISLEKRPAAPSSQKFNDRERYINCIERLHVERVARRSETCGPSCQKTKRTRLLLRPCLYFLRLMREISPTISLVFIIDNPAAQHVRLSV